METRITKRTKIIQKNKKEWAVYKDGKLDRIYENKYLAEARERILEKENKYEKVA